MDVDNLSGWVKTGENGTANLTAAADIHVKIQNTSLQMDLWEDIHSTEVARLETHFFTQEQVYKDFTTTAQILILIGSLLGKAMTTEFQHKCVKFIIPFTGSRVSLHSQILLPFTFSKLLYYSYIESDN